MVGTAVTRLTSAADFCQQDDMGSGSGFSNVTVATTTAANLSDPCAQSQCDELRAEIAVSLSLLVGILMVRRHMWPEVSLVPRARAHMMMSYSYRKEEQ